MALPVETQVSEDSIRLIGFATAEESAEAQEFLLTAPIPEVRRRQREWDGRANVRRIRFANPEPPTRGPTAWLSKEIAGLMS